MRRLTPALCQSACDRMNAEKFLPRHISFRQAMLADLDAIMDIGLKGFATDQIERPKMRHFLTKAHAAIALVCDGASVIGFIHVEGHAGRKNIYLNTITLLDEYRGRGIGLPMYRWVDVLAEMVGAKSIWCHVAVDNDLALHLLKKNGFILERTLDPYYYDDNRAAHVMRKYVQQS